MVTLLVAVVWYEQETVGRSVLVDGTGHQLGFVHEPEGLLDLAGIDHASSSLPAGGGPLGQDVGCAVPGPGLLHHRAEHGVGNREYRSRLAHHRYQPRGRRVSSGSPGTRLKVLQILARLGNLGQGGVDLALTRVPPLQLVLPDPQHRVAVLLLIGRRVRRQGQRARSTGRASTDYRRAGIVAFVLLGRAQFEFESVLFVGRILALLVATRPASRRKPVKVT